MDMINISFFTAPPISKFPLNAAMDNVMTEKAWHYSSSGSASIFHILKSTNATSVVALPSYMCKSVLVPIRRLGLKFATYDSNSDDLNPSVESLRSLLKTRTVSHVIFPSLYGLPARCDLAETLCREYGVHLIDDAAQSFGSSLDNRRIGTFGNSGLISFSPGKATPGHCGSFFWSDAAQYNIKYTTPFAHGLIRWLYQYSRVEGQMLAGQSIRRALIKLYTLLKSNLDYNAYFGKFEEDLLGGILIASSNGFFDYRNVVHKYACEKLNIPGVLRVVTSSVGVSNPHKIVIVASNNDVVNKLDVFFHKVNVEFGKGYCPISFDDAPNAKAFSKYVLEIPLVSDVQKMKLLIDAISNGDWQ